MVGRGGSCAAVTGAAVNSRMALRKGWLRMQGDRLKTEERSMAGESWCDGIVRAGAIEEKTLER